MTDNILNNYYSGDWVAVESAEVLAVHNPATNEVIGKVPLSPAEEVDKAVQAANAAFPGWQSTPAPSRIQPLFKLKDLLEDHFDDLARMI